MEALICLFLPVYMPIKFESARLPFFFHPLTVLEVSMGGLSLMSVTVMMAVAVLERPKFRFPSMSVACTMMVYWETFCGRCKRTAVAYLFIRSSAGTAAKLSPERSERGPSDFSSSLPPRSSFKTSSVDQVWDRLKAAASPLPVPSSSKLLPIG